jgi:hypothetical protein
MSSAAKQVATGAWAGTAGSSQPKVGMTANNTTQATATVLSFEYNEFGTVAASGAAVLPTSQQMGGVTPGDDIVVANLGANALVVFPPVGGKIGTAAANASVSVPAGKSARFYASLTTGNWTANISA